MNATDNIIMPTTCANCGKGEEESVALKNCVACKMVKYCGRDCQKAHRSQHKKECRKRAAELHEYGLFKQPPKPEDCPICFVQLPSFLTASTYMGCCGKTICNGCIHANARMNKEQKCPFCRTPAPTSDKKIIKRIIKRVEMGDPRAMHQLGSHYAEGIYGLPQNHAKALELWHQSAELGNTAAYLNIGNAYWCGRGVERNEKKADYYYELAAMGGVAEARYNLGNAEIRAGNMDRALKHYMIAVGSGHNASLKMIKELYTHGQATKDDYAKALKAYQAYLGEIKSDDRDQAAAFDDEYQYYE